MSADFQTLPFVRKAITLKKTQTASDRALLAVLDLLDAKIAQTVAAREAAGREIHTSNLTDEEASVGIGSVAYSILEAFKRPKV